MSKKIFYLALSGFFMTAAAYAASFEGVVSARPGMNVFNVTRTDRVSANRPIRVLVDDHTRFVGVDSVEDLRPGDPVRLKARPDPETKSWVARAVELKEPAAQDEKDSETADVIDDEAIRSDHSSLAPSTQPHETMPSAGVGRIAPLPSAPSVAPIASLRSVPSPSHEDTPPHNAGHGEINPQA